MTTQVGRLTLPTGATLSRSSGSMRYSGHLNRSAEHAVIRAQLDGLIEASRPPFMDEPIVPVVDTDLGLSLFARVVGGGWTTIEGGGQFGNAFDWDLDLEPVAGNPSMESILTGALRTNSHGITATNVKGWHGVPELANAGYGFKAAGAYVPQNTGASRIVEGGEIVYVRTPSSGSMLAGLAQWRFLPEEYYVGAATLRDADDNLLVGRSGVPLTLSNGTLKVTLAAVPGPQISVSVMDSGAWSTAHGFNVADLFGLDLITATILQNTPEQVRIKVNAGILGSLVLVSLYLTLRRGSRMVQCSIERSVAAVTAVKHSADATSSALTGGIKRASDDASGNRWVLSSPTTFSTVTTPAGISFASSTAAYWAIGMELNGGSATSPQDAQSLIYQYMAAQSEWQRVVEG